jgi:hypothetical protein
MTDEQVAPDLISAGTQALVEDPKRLGLIWTVRLGTVITSITGSVTVTCDGDTVPINVVSTIGTLGVGARVYVLIVPPSGNFVVGQVAMMENGEELISFVGATSATLAVTFRNPFLAVPIVTTNINSGSGSTAGWDSRAFGITTTGFTIFVFGSVNTWSNVGVQWQAVAPS